MQTPKEEYFQLGIYPYWFLYTVVLRLFSQGVEHGHIHVHEGSSFFYSPSFLV